MCRLHNAALAACTALVLSLGSIGATVNVPPAQAQSPAMLALPAIA